MSTAPTAAGRRSPAHERFAVWVVTGPVGRVSAFVIDASILWFRWAVANRIAARRGRR